MSWRGPQPWRPSVDYLAIYLVSMHRMTEIDPIANCSFIAWYRISASSYITAVDHLDNTETTGEHPFESILCFNRENALNFEMGSKTNSKWNLIFRKTNKKIRQMFPFESLPMIAIRAINLSAFYSNWI